MTWQDLAADSVKLVPFLLQKRYGHVDQDDASAGYLGLCIAAKRYEPSKAEFSTFAAFHIQGSVNERRRNESFGFRLPKGGRLGPVVRSLDSDPSTLDRDVGIDDTSMDAATTRLYLEYAMEVLTPRERLALRLYYWHDMRQVDVGRALGVSKIQTSRIIRAALAKLRSALEDAP